ncbi:MAG: hypothetical protein E7448_08645, partial [Ruminococcaceae bacterium]|nr:hypothetical protein [Oscillospiraceae bacterium]
MKRVANRGLSLLLVMCMIVSIFIGVLPVDTEAANNSPRHTTCTSLSSQAVSYYTGSYAYDTLSSLQGGTSSCLDTVGTPLYEALQALMSSTMKTSISYSSLTNYWPTTDGNILFYSDFESTGYNREHVWPKSHASFHEKNGGCDLHHLRPTNSDINSTRSNYTFGNVKAKISGYRTKDNGGQTVLWYVPSSSYSVGGSDGLVEVMDNIKGDVARILLYVYVRWEEPNLFEKAPNPVVGTGDQQNDGMKVIEDLETLLQWMEIDPVDQWEMTRNDLTQNVQGNRNVFIDYPELAWNLFGQTAPANMTTPSGNSGSGGNPSCSHANTTIRNASNATCTTAGYTGDTYCSDCGGKLKTGSSISATGHSFVAGTCSACGIAEPNAITTDRYYIATIRSSGNYFYMTNSLGTASTKRYQAVDSGLTTLPTSIAAADVEDKYVFVLIDNGDDTYSLQAAGVEGNNYLGWTSGNSGTFVAESSALKLTKTENSDGTVNFHFAASDAERYLSLNATSGNNYFAWYKTGQKKDLVLIPVVDSESETPDCDHSYTSVTIDPDCTTAGSTTYTCTECGHSYTESIAAFGHDYFSEITTDADCENAGVITYTCNNCNHSYTEAISATGHNYSETITAQPGCETTGSKTSTCTTCGNTVTESMPAIGHSWDNGVVTKPATLTSTGVMTYTCSNCSGTKTETIPVLQANTTESINIAGTGIANAADFTGLTFGNGAAVLVASKANGSNAPKYYSSDYSARFYNKNTLVFTPGTGYTITEIVLTAVSSALNLNSAVTIDNATLTTDGTTATLVPIDPTQPVTITNTKSSNAQIRLTDIAVTYAPIVAAHEHTAGEAVKENETAPTCDVAGSYDNVVYCSGCGEEISRETIIVPALGHSYAYTNNGNNT